MAGVDALLREELGSEYLLAANGIWWAGFTVAQLMRELGFVEAGTIKCPPDCSAAQGILWKPKPLSGEPGQVRFAGLQAIMTPDPTHPPR